MRENAAIITAATERLPCAPATQQDDLLGSTVFLPTPDAVGMTLRNGPDRARVTLEGCLNTSY